MPCTRSYVQYETHILLGHSITIDDILGPQNSDQIYIFLENTAIGAYSTYVCGGGMGEMIWVGLPLRILNINANQGKMILSTDKSHNLHASSVFSYNIKFVVVYIIIIRYYCV